MAEEQPADAQEQSEQQPLDYSGESVEDLEARLLRGEGLIVEREDESPPTPEQEPEPQAEAEPEGKSEPGESVEEAEQKPEAAEPEELDPRELQLQEMELKLRQVENERNKWQLLQGAQAGRAGHLEKKLEELTEALRYSAQQPQQDYAEQGVQPQPVPRQAPQDTGLQSTVAELQQEVRARAIEQEYTSFIQANQDAAGLMEQMAPSIKQQYEQYKDVELGTQATRKLIRMMLDTAYADVKMQEVRTKREEALKKVASQVPAKRKAKQVASVSGSGSSPGPKPTPKRPEDMTAEEADAALIAEFGDGVYRRSPR